MGKTHIILIREDAIRNAKTDADRKEYAAELGDQTLKLCLDPATEQTPEGLVPRRDAAIFNYGNGIDLVSSQHSRDPVVLYHSHNCVRPLHELDAEELAEVKGIVDAQIEASEPR